MKFDTHMHTAAFSEDGVMTMEELLRRQRTEAGGVTITEHFDYDFPAPFTFRFDPAEYFQTYGKYRKEGDHAGEMLLLGIEIGLQPSCAARNDWLVSSWPFDLVIGSTHLVDGYDLAENGYFQGKEKRDAYRHYFETIYENILAYDNYDVMGHIDYAARYAPYEDPVLRYEEYKEIIDEILHHLVRRGKILELNTRQFSDERAVRNLEPIYRRYRELGGRDVTFGSDAHTAQAVFANFDRAQTFAASCGLRPVYFCGRKRQSAAD